MNKPASNKSETQSKREVAISFKQRLEGNVVWWSLTLVVAGFIAGVGCYKGLLEITNQTTIQKGSLISQADLERDYIKRTEIPDTGTDHAQLNAELRCRAKQARNALEYINDDLGKAEYGPRWIYTLTLELLDGRNSRLLQTSPNLYPQYKNKDFPTMIRDLQIAKPNKKQEGDVAKSNYDNLRGLAAASPEKASTDESKSAVKNAMEILSNIEMGINN
jgi:hypothetical protein